MVDEDEARVRLLRESRLGDVMKKIMCAESSEHECPAGLRAYRQLGSFMIHETKRLMLHKIKSLISYDDSD